MIITPNCKKLLAAATLSTVVAIAGSVMTVESANATQANPAQTSPIYAYPDEEFTTPGQAVTIDPLKNDVSPVDFDRSTLTLFDPLYPEEGTFGSLFSIEGQWVANADGTISYTPNADWRGSAQIGYQVTTTDGKTARSTVKVVTAAAPASPTVDIHAMLTVLRGSAPFVWN